MRGITGALWLERADAPQPLTVAEAFLRPLELVEQRGVGGRVQC